MSAEKERGREAEDPQSLRDAILSRPDSDREERVGIIMQTAEDSDPYLWLSPLSLTAAGRDLAIVRDIPNLTKVDTEF